MIRTSKTQTTRAKKATFSLRPEVLEALDRAVAQGAAPSKNALVEKAIIREIDVLRRDQIRLQLEEAMADPLFLNDLAEVDADFHAIDAESDRTVE